MQGFIREAFLPMDAIRLYDQQITHVAKGCYDLISSSGEIVLPSLWEDVVEPDCEFTILFWNSDLVSKLKY